MDGDKDKPQPEWSRWIDYYGTAKAKCFPNTPSKVVNKKIARRLRRRLYRINIELENEGI